jgi:hypothetical protein
MAGENKRGERTKNCSDPAIQQRRPWPRSELDSDVPVRRRGAGDDDRRGVMGLAASRAVEEQISAHSAFQTRSAARSWAARKPRRATSPRSCRDECSLYRDSRRHPQRATRG